MQKLLSSLLLMFIFSFNSTAATLHDHTRNRPIPIALTYPTDNYQCTSQTKCAVAFLSAGYGVAHTDYQFIAKVFNRAGFLVVAIGHELKNDPPLSVTGNLYQTRSENWIRGAATLEFVQHSLAHSLTQYDFTKVTLVGHSNGGDISAWLTNHQTSFVKSVITLDHRRVPLPKTTKISVFSIRASDFPADKDVLPTAAEQLKFGSCVVTIADAKHNDISDFGPSWLKTRISTLLASYLANAPCTQLTEQANEPV